MKRKGILWGVLFFGFVGIAAGFGYSKSGSFGLALKSEFDGSRKPSQATSGAVGVPATTGAPVSAADGNWGGTNTGGGEGGSDYVIQWCNGSLGDLDQALIDARSSMRTSDFAGAKQKLRAAMEKAMQRAPAARVGRALTYRAIEEGQLLTNALTEISAGQPEPDVMVVEFLIGSRDEKTGEYRDGWFDFIKYVAKNVDLEYHIPGLYINPRPAALNLIEYERRFTAFGRELISFTMRRFTKRDSNGEIVGRFGSKPFLKASEMVTSFAAALLNDSLSRARYSCTIERLGTLNAKIAGFNAGNRADYSDPRIAVQLIYAALSDIDAEINSVCGH